MRQQRPAGHPLAHHRARLGHPLRQHQQRRRSAHQLAAEQDRPRLPGCRSSTPSAAWATCSPTQPADDAAVPHAAGSVLHGDVRRAARGAELRLVHGCWRGSSTSTPRAISPSSPTGCTGTCVSTAAAPAIVFDASDADQVAFVQEATRYYQIYDGEHGRLLVAVAAGFEPLGLHFTPDEVRGVPGRAGAVRHPDGLRPFPDLEQPDVAGPGRALPAAGRRVAATRWTRRSSGYLDLLLWSALPACSSRSSPSGGWSRRAWRR